MSSLEIELKQMLIEVLHLEDMEVDDINSHAALFGDGLGLDSIDALELGVAIQKRYGITLLANSEEARQHFASIDSLAAMITNFNSKKGEQ